MVLKGGVPGPTQNSQAEQSAVVVGIDFGTARSGWCYSRQVEGSRGGWSAPAVISRYNGHTDLTQCKTPTVLLYEVADDGKSWRLADNGWGFPAYRRYCEESLSNRRLRLVEEFKLWLRDESPKAELKCPVPTLEAIAAFLQLMHADILQRLGPSQAQQVTYCMTIPAGWTHTDRVQMRRAACEAGLVDDPCSERLHILLEPEAAALCASFDNKLVGLKAGDHILMVDAGGGTTDIIMYELAAGPQDGLLLLQQQGQPRMIMKGSKMLDRQFQQIVKQTLGQEFYVSFLSSHHGDFLTTTMARWQDKKHSFTGDDGANTPPAMISLPTSMVKQMPAAVKQRLQSMRPPQAGYHDRIVLPAATIKQMFDKVVNDICAEVESQAEGLRNLKRIFVAGGLGSSPYLHKRLMEVAAGLPSQPMVHLSCDVPHAAIVKGAVRHCLNPNHVASRTCLKTYGIKVYAEWDDRMDRAARDQAKRDPKFGNRLMVGEVFDTLVRKGDVVKVGDSVRRTFPLSCLQKPFLEVWGTDRVYRAGECPLTSDAGMVRVGSVPIKGSKTGLQKLKDTFRSRPSEVVVEFFFGGSEIKFDVTYRGQPHPTPTVLKYEVEDTAAHLTMY